MIVSSQLHDEDCSTEHKYHSPNQVLNKKRRPAPTKVLILWSVDKRTEMAMRVTAMSEAVMRNDLRRPRPSIKNTESSEQMAYSVPPQAVMRWLMPPSSWKDSCRIKLL